jgi:hypothetical protein
LYKLICVEQLLYLPHLFAQTIFMPGWFLGAKQFTIFSEADQRLDYNPRSH